MRDLKVAVFAVLVGCSIALFGSPPANAFVLSVGPSNSIFGGTVCADVSGGSLNSPTKVQAWSCNGAPNQQFEFNGLTIYTMGGQRCLEVLPGSAGAVVSDICNGTQDQQWWCTFPGTPITTSIRFVSTFAGCLDATNMANGTQLVVNSQCAFATSQNWQIKDAALTFGSSNGMFGGTVCADVNGGSLNPATKVQAWSCNGAPNQQFEFSGSQIYAMGGQRCLEVNGGTVPTSAVDSLTVDSGICSSTSKAQVWIWYDEGRIQFDWASVGGCLALQNTTNGTQLTVVPGNCGAASTNLQIK